MKRKQKKERKKQKRSSTNEERSQSLTVPPGRELINKYNSLSLSLQPPVFFFIAQNKHRISFREQRIAGMVDDGMHAYRARTTACAWKSDRGIGSSKTVEPVLRTIKPIFRIPGARIIHRISLDHSGHPGKDVTG